MRLIATCLAALGLAALSACAVPFVGEDIHLKGRTSILSPENSEYRAVDNAIYDVLCETYGKSRVIMSEYPEKEFHRWVYVSDEYTAGERMRLRVTARPMKDSDGRWYPSLQAKYEVYMKGDPFINGRPGEFGANPFIEGGRGDMLEAKLVNKVMEKVRAWEAANCPDPGSRRDEWIAMRDRQQAARDAAAEAAE